MKSSAILYLRSKTIPSDPSVGAEDSDIDKSDSSGNFSLPSDDFSVAQPDPVGIIQSTVKLSKIRKIDEDHYSMSCKMPDPTRFAIENPSQLENDCEHFANDSTDIP